MSAITDKEAQEAYFPLSRLLNNFSYDRQVEAILKQLLNDHRSLQQGFWRMIFGLIRAYAKIECFDARNERAVEVCRELSEFMEEEYLWQLPTI